MIDIAKTTGPAAQICHCDGCGKCMTDPVTGQTIIALHLANGTVKKGVAVFSSTIHVKTPDEKFMAEQWGPFTKESYSFCYECWLRSLGAVAPNAVQE